MEIATLPSSVPDILLGCDKLLGKWSEDLFRAKDKILGLQRWPGGTHILKTRINNKLQMSMMPEGDQWRVASEISSSSHSQTLNLHCALLLMKAQQSECEATLPPGYRMPLLIVTNYRAENK